MSDRILSEVSAIMGERPASEIARAIVEKYWPGSITWQQITERIRSWSDGPISRDEAYEVAQIAGILGVFGFPEGSQFREEKRVSERDTKFAGFAALVLKEIDDTIGRQTKEAQEYGLTVKDEKKYAHELGTIIARRAYDLACHVWNETVGGGNPEMVINGVRDMPELPEEPK